ncbi:hypothetical protein B0T18DRAFT_389714 [Schizothecium vesticola]|uniref:Uncharacterized protein n=1 Tax=Schizothecium vesticola TaxID=314040 RepID=A0AA40F3G5_9PEZI|nr:hypothetical protein B0T18DRAFT_389714 [Schizothecium vesticola]
MVLFNHGQRLQVEYNRCALLIQPKHTVAIIDLKKPLFSYNQNPSVPIINISSPVRLTTVQLPSPVENIGDRKYFSLPGSAIECDDLAEVRIPYASVHEKVKAAPTLAMAQTMGLKFPHSYYSVRELADGIPEPWVSVEIMAPEYLGIWPGPLRALYNENDRSRFVLMYHDKTRPRRPHSRWYPFSAAVLKFDRNQRSG